VFLVRRSAPAVVIVGALFSLLLGSTPARAVPVGGARSSYAEELVASALEGRLYERAEWHTLLHYDDGWFGTESLVDDPSFFAAPNGKSDPAAELEATVRSFFAAPPDSGKHPVCRFAARFEWLVEELGVDRTWLPVPRCEPVEEIIDRMRPVKVLLSFPTAYMNSPASMYGHTLLTIVTEHDSELLSYAVNYAGETDTSFGPLYALKGVFGFYRGYYSILPYYAKLQEYSDVNDRDIWEYELSLTRAEIRRLILHVYELEDVYSDYYFFDENCSFNLLYLLDAARPGLDLTHDRGLWVLPLDTIRAADEAGLVSDVRYRPSKSTEIAHLASLMSDTEQERAVALARGQVEPAGAVVAAVDPAREARVYDLASEYLQYLYIDGAVSQENYVPRFRRILGARSRLGNPEGERSIPRPPRPDLGHRSSRVGVGGGVLDTRGFARTTYRAVHHDLIDNRGGYLEGAEIVFGELDLRYYPEDEDLQIEAIDLIDIVSLSPRGRFFGPTSWKVRTGWSRRGLGDGRRPLVYDFEYGIGRTYRGGPLGLWYGLADVTVQLGGSLRRNHAAGVGVSAGWLTHLGRRLQFHGFGRAVRFGLGEYGTVIRAGVGQNLELSPNLGLRAEVRRSWVDDTDWWDWTLRLHVYH